MCDLQYGALHAVVVVMVGVCTLALSSSQHIFSISIQLGNIRMTMRVHKC